MEVMFVVVKYLTFALESTAETNSEQIIKRDKFGASYRYSARLRLHRLMCAMHIFVIFLLKLRAQKRKVQLKKNVLVRDTCGYLVELS